MSSIAAEKALRREKLRRAALPDAEREASDRLLFSRFFALPQARRAKTLLLFWGVRSEPDTARLFQPLVEAGQRIALPRCLPGRRMESRIYRGAGHITVGPYGIPEPDADCPLLDRSALELILVPGLCCDRCGFRLGHGGGYYDRYLSGYSGDTVALCRDTLLADRLPVDSHDIPVRFVLTESQTLRF